MPRPEENPIPSSLQREASQQQPRKDLWYIHGKAYDLSSFVERHPGGRNNLLETRGRNVTELFESVHALSATNVRAMLSKFEVLDVPVIESPFTYEKDGVFQEISRRVRKRFEGQTYKATTGYYIQLIFMIALYAGLMYAWSAPKNQLDLGGFRPLASFLAGVLDDDHFLLWRDS